MKPLRLVIFDETDAGRRVHDLADVNLPGDLENAEAPLLSASWFTGATLFRLLRRFDDSRGFRTWNQALDWLAHCRDGQPVSEIQFWGHGTPGKIWMNRETLTADLSAYSAHVIKIKQRLAPGALIWFRTCSTFCGRVGQEFARSWSRTLGCRVAGHTHRIGFWHSGLHSLAPDQEPGWSECEGIEYGTPEAVKRTLWSQSGSPNTIWFLRPDLPRGW